MYVGHVLLLLLFLVGLVLVQILRMRLSVGRALVQPKQLCIIITATPATSSSVPYVKLTMLVTLVKLPSFQLPVEVQLVFVLQLMSNQAAHVSAHLELWKIMANAPNALLPNVPNAQPSLPAKLVLHPSS